MIPETTIAEIKRRADIGDIGGILRLIEPLEAGGILVQRSREQIELEIDHFQVIEKDGMIIACIACITDSAEDLAEIACLAVHDDYQRNGLGNQLLQSAEMRASQTGISRLFTLTTRTSHWFIEQGFTESPGFELPASRRSSSGSRSPRTCSGSRSRSSLRRRYRCDSSSRPSTIRTRSSSEP